MAFVVCVTILIFLALGAAYYIKKEHDVKVKEKREQENLSQEKEQDEQTKQEALKARGKSDQAMALRTPVSAVWKRTADASPGLQIQGIRAGAQGILFPEDCKAWICVGVELQDPEVLFMDSASPWSSKSLDMRVHALNFHFLSAELQKHLGKFCFSSNMSPLPMRSSCSELICFLLPFRPEEG